MNRVYCDVCNKQLKSFNKGVQIKITDYKDSVYRYKVQTLCENCKKELYKFLKIK